MLNKTILTQLKAILPPERIFTAREDRLVASYDASKHAALPDVVIKPKTAKEISTILKIANDYTIPVYPRGAASSVTGSAVPIKGGIVIETSLMNQILQINKSDFVGVVEPGVVTQDFQKAVEAYGLFYPPDPASAEVSTIGGNIATCAGGLRCVKYGVTRDYVLGLEVVLPDGSIIHTGSQSLKCVTGYDLTRLLVGSEGTLGIFTKIILRLIPKPEHRETILMFYPEVNLALDEGRKILASGLQPVALEFMDELSTRAVQNYHKDFAIPQDTKAILLLEMDGPKLDTLRQAEEIYHLLENGQPIKIMRARNQPEAEALWKVRRAISPALWSITSQKISEDISLPLSQIKTIIQHIGFLQANYGIPIAVFGHLGDGNLHVNFLVSVPAQVTVVDKVLEDLFKETIRLGGTLSGEHGIGLTKLPYLDLEISHRELKLMKDLKSLFDPKNIMNPGKMF